MLASLAPLPTLAQAGAPPTRDDLSLGRPGALTDGRNDLRLDENIERGPCPFAADAFASTRVNFARVEFTGLPDIPASTLDGTWSELAGRDLPVLALCEVRDRAATVLRARGYLAAVQIPPQRIEAGGIVRMDVLAARLVELQVRGDAGAAESLVEAQLAPLTEARWFNSRDVERSLLLLQDMPGYDARLTLRSAQRDPGEVVGDIFIDYRPVELVVGGQNYGSRATGREGAFAELALNGLLGRGDRTTASFYNTLDWDEQRIFRFSHELALDDDGLRLGGSVLLGRTEPSLAGGAFESETLAAELHVRKAIRRSQASSLFATGGFELVDQELDFGATRLSNDRLRVLYARIDHFAADPGSIAGRGGFSVREPRWRSAISLEIRQGLGVLGASRDCNPLADCLAPNIPISNVLADPSSLSARLEGQLEFRPAPRVTFAVAPLVQVSDGPLLSYEQVSLGNYTIGRGLDPGIALGDNVIGASFELRAGSLHSSLNSGLALEPFAFFDYARAWIDDNGLNPDPRDVVTAGAGLRARFDDRFDVGLTYARPLQAAGYQAARSKGRVLVSVTARLLPWGERR